MLAVQLIAPRLLSECYLTIVDRTHALSHALRFCWQLVQVEGLIVTTCCSICNLNLFKLTCKVWIMFTWCTHCIEALMTLFLLFIVLCISPCARANRWGKFDMLVRSIDEGMHFTWWSQLLAGPTSFSLFNCDISLPGCLLMLPRSGRCENKKGRACVDAWHPGHLANRIVLMMVCVMCYSPLVAKLGESVSHFIGWSAPGEEDAVQATHM